MADQITTLKEMARAANKARDYKRLRNIIAKLDRVWHDDRAAMAFYTELEQEALA